MFLTLKDLGDSFGLKASRATFVAVMSVAFKAPASVLSNLHEKTRRVSKFKLNHIRT